MKEKVLETVNEKTKLIIIDGKSASGKTTLAKELEKQLGGQLIHMDDFFLPIYLRTSARFEEPGGNVHYERFLQEVVKPIKTGKGFSYRIFSCREMDYVGEKWVDPSKLIIIEGAYGLHPLFQWEKTDEILKVFLDIAEEKQLQRIEKRNGPIFKSIFEEKWIPMENMYFKAFDIPKQCQVVIKNA